MCCALARAASTRQNGVEQRSRGREREMAHGEKGVGEAMDGGEVEVAI